MKNIHLILFAVILISCRQETVKETSLADPDPVFEAYKNDFIEHLWVVYPEWSTGLGYEQYDHLISIPDEKKREGEMDFINHHLKQLQTFETAELSPSNKTDYHLIRNLLEKNKWRIETFREFEWNPASYNVAGGFAKILGNKKISPEEKISRAGARLEYVPGYYLQAQKNIKYATLEHTDLAIQQSKGTKKYLGTTLRDSARKALPGSDQYGQFEKKLDDAVKAVDTYIVFLEEELKPALLKKGAKNYRIGKELFEEKFQLEIQSSYTAEEIYERALITKTELHSKMAGIASGLWPKYFPGQATPGEKSELVKTVLNKISEKHVHRDSFITAIEQQIPELEKFIREKDLIYMDPSKPLVVRKTPDYMDGMAGASISSPGPYDKSGDTYYNVTPLTGYTEEQAESYLREYNHYVLQILNIHEAIPGHYLQLVYSNQSPSLIKSILGNGSMIEGWAVYTERMMLEEGYGNDDPEMWLMYFKWHLRVVCNTILDYSVHVLGFEEEQGLNLLMNEAFQEETEARGKWKRATLSQVQLCSYFTGFSEIYALREELKEKMGKDFNLKDFHEKFLSYGSAPVKYIRELMLNELEKKSDAGA